MEKKINKPINVAQSVKVNFKTKKIIGNIFPKAKTNKINSVKAGKTIKGKINLKK